jgi:hypothetical protein
MRKETTEPDFTSLCRCGNSNYQIDHSNVASFEAWCVENKAEWGHLFVKWNGKLAASYDHKIGLLTSSPP